MKLTDRQLKRLKLCELEIFKSFIEICEKLQLKYYLIEGTLLGAVRHQGFIPWDDDIDVGMPRKDFNIFIEKAQKFLPPHLFLQTNKSDSEYFNGFAKIRNSNTTYIEISAKESLINHGIFIDVFPLDWYPNRKIQQKITNIKEFRYKMAIYKSDKNEKNKWKKMMKFLLSLGLTKRKAYDEKEKWFKDMKESDFIRNYSSAYGKREIFPKEWFGEGKKLAFENIEVIVPKEYDLFLKQVYGNYMELPPIEERVGKHFVDCIDFEKSYLEYRNR